MGSSRAEFDSHPGALDPDSERSALSKKDGSDYLSLLTSPAVHIHSQLDPLMNPESLDPYGPNAVAVSAADLLDPKDTVSRNASSTTVTGTTVVPGDHLPQVGPTRQDADVTYFGPQEQTDNMGALGSAFDHNMWWNGQTNAADAPQLATPSIDPIINVVAPDEVSSETKQYVDESFPMYSVDGIPIHDSQVPEFQQPKSNSDAGIMGGDLSAVSPSLPSSVSGSGGPTPYGTPQTSPLIVPHTPNSTTYSGNSPIGSPFTTDGPHSPYDAPYYSYRDSTDDALSPLISDDKDPLFDTAPAAPYLSRNSSLTVPDVRKSRAMSDSWSPHERDAFLSSIDAQTQMAQSLMGNADMGNSHDGSRRGSNFNTPVGVNYLVPDAVSQIQFPSYTPVNVRPHSPNMLYAGGSSTSGESRANSSSSSRSSSEASPNTNQVMGDRTFPDDGSNYSSSPQLTVPMNGRSRSLSSPYEHTNDLKSSQMFSCELCGKRFTRAYNLRSHMRTHTDERPFACQHCGKAFARQHDRKRHEALHSGEKRFVCYGLTHGFQWGCRKRFARADALGRHFRTEAGKNCLRPLIDRICVNGSYSESAPEGILFGGFVDNQPQLMLNIPERDSGASLTSEEREEQTRRTVIVTAVTEQFQELVDGLPHS